MVVPGNFLDVTADPTTPLFRYISLQTPDFIVTFGMKDIQKETKLEPRLWRTSIPEGDFEKQGTVRIAGGTAERRYLVYQDKQGEHVQSIWYCAPASDLGWCNSFSVGNEKAVSIEISAIDDQYSGHETVDWEPIRKETESVFKLVHVFVPTE